MLCAISGYSQTVDNLNPGSNFPVDCLAVQTDGKIIAGGEFTQLGGKPRTYLGRLNPDGKLDESFNPYLDGGQYNKGWVYAVAILPDGKILVGGDFVTLAGQPRNFLGRLYPDGSLDTNFTPQVGYTVNCLVVQKDGKIVVGGRFSDVGGYSQLRIGRLNADGTGDGGFASGGSDAVGSTDILCLALQDNGQILAGGSFTKLSSYSRSRIGRLSASGAMDTTFNPGASNTVWCLAVQPDGRILVGGAFTVLGGQPRNYIGRLNTDGSVDMTFNPGANAQVEALALQADGKILVGGGFTNLAGQSRNFIGRLNPDGTVDPSFNIDANYYVRSITVQGDGKVLLSGSFSMLGGQTRNGTARLINTDAATQSLTNQGPLISWTRGGTAPEVSSTTLEISTNNSPWTNLGPGQRISGGWQWALSGLPLNAGLRAHGFVQPGMQGGAGWFVEDIAGPPRLVAQPASIRTNAAVTVSFAGSAVGTPPLGYQWRKGGTNLSGASASVLTLTNVLLGDVGDYSLFVSNKFGSVTSAIASLTLILPVADSWNPGASNGIFCTALQTDGKVIVAGPFTSLCGQPRKWLGRINPDGTLDAAFNPQPNAIVNCVAIQPDGKILVGGQFTSLGGQVTHVYLDRLNPDGNLDSGFPVLVANGAVSSIALQPDGKVLVGGLFTSLGGQYHVNIGRINADGTGDGSFNPGTDGAINCVALQADGKILVGGTFSHLNGQSRAFIGRLNPEGTLDGDFNPVIGGYYLNCILTQPDGKILIGGNYNLIGGQPSSYVSRLFTNGTLDATFNPDTGNPIFCLAMQTDGKVLLGGDFSSLGGETHRYVGRLNPDGTVDSTFASEASGGSVRSIAIDSEGRILLGGLFTNFGGQSRNSIARLFSTQVATNALVFDGSTINWVRGGSSPEASFAVFETSDDGVNWTSVGSIERFAQGWRKTGLSLTTNVAVRARAYVNGGQYNGSSWFIETSLPFVGPIRPSILSRSNSFGMTSNRFGFHTQASAGQIVVIEASTNFTLWNPIQTNLVTAGGVFFFADPDTAKFHQRFYRARLYKGPLPPPSMIALPGNAAIRSNHFSFNLAGIPGQTVVVEASTNLAAWAPLVTNTLDANTYFVIDPTSLMLPGRFYRVRVQ